MAETKKLVQLLQQQLEQQQQQMEQQRQQMGQQQQQMEQQRYHMEQQQRQHAQQIEQQQQQHAQQMEALLTALKTNKVEEHINTPVASIPTFSPFDATSELWSDYWARFNTFIGAHSIPEERKAQVFLTNQSTVTYKLLANLASQQKPPKDINELSINDIEEFMKIQFDPSLYIVRERFKYWSDMQRKPGETIQELAARIRQDAVTCDFASIKDPLDEALRTRFICSVNNEAVLKALFKIKDDDLTFSKAINVAIETEDAAKVAKETVSGFKPKAVHTISTKRKPSKQQPSKPVQNEGTKHFSFPKGTCGRCGKKDHKGNDCPFKDSTCHYCQRKGHIEPVCLQKKQGKPRQSSSVNTISMDAPITIDTVKVVNSVPQVIQPIELNGLKFNFEVDTGAAKSFCSEHVWTKLGKPALTPTTHRYQAATGHPLPVKGTFKTTAKVHNQPGMEHSVQFTVTSCPKLNLLGRDAILEMGIDVTSLMANSNATDSNKCNVHAVSDSLQPDKELQKACQQLCTEFPDVFKPELGCLKDFQLEVKFKPDAKPVFCKPRTVPFAIQEDLNQAYDAGIAKGVWKPTDFNSYGTPVVPVRKALLPGQTKAKLRVCGDYSVSVNQQLEEHRHPLPLPEDLMRKLGGGCGFTKIDLADAYNQIMLATESQKRLALSTHRGVLLQLRLPFGIQSAPGYFQQIMDQLTSDLTGVAVYLDDILVSGANSQEHLQNLRALLKRLDEKGLRCNLDKCTFAQPVVEYLGHTLSRNGIAKGPKVDAVLNMPPPSDVSSLRSFMGSVQFYGKFLPNLSTVAEPLNRLTKKDTPWNWGAEEQTAFQHIKDLLCMDTVLAHFDPSQQIGISCDASDVGIGAVLFHRYDDGSERPIANVSKTLTSTQRKYSQIQKEALSIVFALHKFHQFLYGRKFILVTDHKPLIALFGPNKATPALAANRLARWALMLHQYDYSIEYRKTSDHGNADALSRLPAGPDHNFDGEESGADIDTVCLIKMISMQLKPIDSGVLTKETAKDPVLSAVMRYTREGWPPKSQSETVRDTNKTYTVEDFRKISDSLSTAHGCLLYGSRVIIPETLHAEIVHILHMGHFGMQRMKQLARTAVYWPRIDSDIVSQCQRCGTCAEHQNKPAKPTNHPWMLPEKPWSRVHLDHAINFLGSNWLVLIDAYTKYPCIHPTSSTSTKATTDLLEQDFAHFGYPHTIVTDNATTFLSQEFQTWCKDRGIIHLTGAPYHPATNGAAERLVQTFKQALKKSSLPPKAALQEFLMQYRRTPLSSGYSPSELLNGRQIRAKIDTLLPSPAHKAQGIQAREATKSQQKVAKLENIYSTGTPCYALYCGPRRDKDPRWVPAIVTKVFGTRSVNVRVCPRGPTWRRHIEQLRPRYSQDKDDAPDPSSGLPEESPKEPEVMSERQRRRNPRLPSGGEYGPDNLRRSKRRSTKH